MSCLVTAALGNKYSQYSKDMTGGSLVEGQRQCCQGLWWHRWVLPSGNMAFSSAGGLQFGKLAQVQKRNKRFWHLGGGGVQHPGHMSLIYTGSSNFSDLTSMLFLGSPCSINYLHNFHWISLLSCTHSNTIMMMLCPLSFPMAISVPNSVMTSLAIYPGEEEGHH